MDLQEFCRALPKIELHAHLNGSLSIETMKKLSQKKNSSEWNDYDIMALTKHSSLDECFKVFAIAHSLTDTPQAVSAATRDTIEEFYRDNVIYLELRSTPRAVEGKMTKMQYVNAIISGIQASAIKCPNIIVKLLISLDRKDPYEVARENAELAISLHTKYPNYIVGIDLSGDPTKGDAYLHLLEQCRQVGLKISAHCGEVPNEMEIVDILNFRPDRLGHCTAVHPHLRGSDYLYQMLLQSRIPVELCLTSNVKCKTVPSYEQHHFAYLYHARHPICIATDDKGVFDTSLSMEYALVGKYFGLTQRQLKDISLMSVQYAFGSDMEKSTLAQAINAFPCY
ncbi:adenosine deaminase-like protein [Venturia canescens]|uniref:adenosine deaminase-like protein n=1 Tax=Venturia canescens TaxID=32260 RepID=UPI001C9C513B|nr:adenosine deaminase-like protein [Venturia canescens]